MTTSPVKELETKEKETPTSPVTEIETPKSLTTLSVGPDIVSTTNTKIELAEETQEKQKGINSTSKSTTDTKSKSAEETQTLLQEKNKGINRTSKPTPNKYKKFGTTKNSLMNIEYEDDLLELNFVGKRAKALHDYDYIKKKLEASNKNNQMILI